jgi:hypothetical protein
MVAPMAGLLGAAVGTVTTVLIHRARERADLQRQLEKLIEENDENIRLAAELVTLLAPGNAQLKNLIDEAYILWITDAKHRAAPPSACTSSRLREVVHATVVARFEADYKVARQADEWEESSIAPNRLTTMSRGEVLAIAKGLPAYDRIELAASYRRSREELTEDVKWIFRRP